MTKIIEDNQFNSRIDLKEYVVEEGTTRIGSCAFFKCINLEKITIP